MSLFITFEGPEGSGKSTQIQLLSQYLTSRNVSHVITREPGGTPFGDHLRSLLFDPRIARTNLAEALLIAAGRNQHVVDLILPNLAKGITVISDRYVDSTLAYQGFGQIEKPDSNDINNLTLTIPQDTILDNLRTINRIATLGLNPDITFLLDIDPIIGLNRKRTFQSDEWNHFEDRVLEYHQRVRQGYLKLASEETQRWQVFDASQPIRNISPRIISLVESRIN